MAGLPLRDTGLQLTGRVAGWWQGTTSGPLLTKDDAKAALPVDPRGPLLGGALALEAQKLVLSL